MPEVVTPRARIRQLIECAAFHPGVAVGDIIGVSRFKRVHAARLQAIVTVRDHYPKMSLPHLGDIFKRDHSTILHALRVARARGIEPMEVDDVG